MSNSVLLCIVRSAYLTSNLFIVLFPTIHKSFVQIAPQSTLLESGNHYSKSTSPCGPSSWKRSYWHPFVYCSVWADRFSRQKTLWEHQHHTVRAFQPSSTNHPLTVCCCCRVCDDCLLTETPEKCTHKLAEMWDAFEPLECPALQSTALYMTCYIFSSLYQAALVEQLQDGKLSNPLSSTHTTLHSNLCVFRKPLKCALNFLC